VEVVAIVVFVAALLVTLAGTLVFFPALWRGFLGQWSRFPRENRRRGIRGGSVAAVLVGAGSALAVAQPWGPRSIVYVILIGGGGLAVVSLVSVAIEGVRASRRAKEQRSRRGW
jgi:hypothetical protein